MCIRDRGLQGVQGPIGNFQGTQGLQGVQSTQGTQGRAVSIPDQSVIIAFEEAFDGSRTTFTPYDKAAGIGDANRFINSEIDSLARFILSVGGIIQEPDTSGNRGFDTSGGGGPKGSDPIKIVFAEAPKVTDTFFGYAIKSTNSPTNINQYATTEDAIAYSIVFGV